MSGSDLQEVLTNIKTAQQKPLGSLAKSTFTENMSATSGLTFYDLELGAKFIYPVLTPLRNMIPRISGKGGIQANWRSVTAINTQGLRFGVSNANRGGVLAVATQDYSAAYKGIGVETSVDFEAQYAGQGFDDIRAIAAKTGLESLMLGEEAMILGGNSSIALGTTPTPTLSDMGTGGPSRRILASASSASRSRTMASSTRVSPTASRARSPAPTPTARQTRSAAARRGGPPTRRSQPPTTGMRPTWSARPSRLSAARSAMPGSGARRGRRCWARSRPSRRP